MRPEKTRYKEAGKIIRKQLVKRRPSWIGAPARANIFHKHSHLKPDPFQRSTQPYRISIWPSVVWEKFYGPQWAFNTQVMIYTHRWSLNILRSEKMYEECSAATPTQECDFTSLYFCCQRKSIHLFFDSINAACTRREEYIWGGRRAENHVAWKRSEHSTHIIDTRHWRCGRDGGEARACICDWLQPHQCAASRLLPFWVEHNMHTSDRDTLVAQAMQNLLGEDSSTYTLRCILYSGIIVVEMFADTIWVCLVEVCVKGKINTDRVWHKDY